jgi:hypothetical protein
MMVRLVQTVTLHSLIDIYFILSEYEQGHIPTLVDFDSVLDLFTFCNLIILMNVLDPRTYAALPQMSGESTLELWKNHDRNSIPATERYQMAHARGLCWDILRWFFTAYEIFDKESGQAIEGFNEVAMAYLAHQASVILAYKREALMNGLDDGGCKVKDVEHQLKLCFESYGEIPCILLTTINGNGSLTFPESDKYMVRKLDEPQPHQCKWLLIPRGAV